MKIALNIILAVMVFNLMCGCEVNANASVPNYTNFILTCAGIMVVGYLRIHHRDFMKFLTETK